MKKTIIILLFVVISFLGYSQINQYPYEKGQYYIFDIGNFTIESEKQDTSGSISFINHVEALDTILKVPASNANDTISTIIAAANAIDDSVRVGVLLEEGTVLRSNITVGRSNMYFGSYDSIGGLGIKPIITGSDFLTGITPVYNWTSAWSATLSSANSNGLYYNFRQVVTPTESGSTIRVKFKNGINTAATIAGASIGLRSGTSDDFASTPTRITFSGGLDTVNMVVSGIAEGDDLNYPVVAGTSYLVHVYMKVAYGYSFILSGEAYRSTSTSDNTLTETIDYGASAAATRVVSDVEVVSSAVENLYQKSGITTQPRAMWYNDTIAPLAADTASLDVDGEWYWDSGISTFFVYATSDPNGNVELGQRTRLIDVGSNDNLTFKNLTIQHSNGTSNVDAALYAANRSNITINNCTVRDNNYYGLYLQSLSDLMIKNNTLLRNGIQGKSGGNMRIYTLATGKSNITITNNISNYSGVYGIMVQSNSKANYVRNVSIYGNECNYNNSTGIYITKVDTAVVYNNSMAYNGDVTDADEDYGIAITSCENTDVYNNTITNQLNNDAIQAYSDSTLTYGICENVRIFNNYINGVTNGDGISIIAYDDSTYKSGLIAYNLVANVDRNGMLFEHETGKITKSINVYNNTIYGTGFFGVDANPNYNIVFKNNILFDETFRHTSAVGGFLTTSNNLWYKTTGYTLQYAGTNYTTATITGFEATAQTGDPLFTNTASGDFSVQAGSPAINNGVNLGFTTDILGNPVSATPTIGAYQYITQ